jgi:glycosyltransferase involved in cell wall biosynthesis
MLHLIKKIIPSIKKNGIKITLKKIFNYRKRLSLLKNAIALSEFEKLTQKNTVFPKQIKISIITPLYNTPIKFLKEMIDSVIVQTYGNWELCLADGSDEKHENVMHICQKYSQIDGRIKYKKLEKNFGISENSNKAIEMSSGDYIGIFDHDDLLHPSALYDVMNVICYDDADFIYTDEATFSNNRIINFKHHKPDYAVDTLRSSNYICHFSVFSRKLLDLAGTFRSEYNGSQDHDLILRYTNIATKIIHIPKLLYFWRIHDSSVTYDISKKIYAITAGKNTVKDNLSCSGFSVHVENAIENSCFFRVMYELTEKPLVSIIISNKDSVSLLRVCISSLIEKTTYDSYEIIIVDNNSIEETTFSFYEELKTYTNIYIITSKCKDFNYSELNNFGFQYAKGKQLIFLNNDIEIITPNWIEEMLMYSQRNDVGAVGSKLYYTDNTVQHAGIILGLGGVAGYIFTGESRNFEGYMGRLQVVQNLSAVTSACVMVKRSVFEKAGCFSPEFHISLTEVDLCLKIRNCGYLIVWTPFVEAYHHVSKTQEYPETNEISMFKKKWSKELTAGDPYYNCNFSLKRVDYSL